MNEQSHCVCNYLNKNQDKCQKKKNQVKTLLVQTLSTIHLPNNLMAKMLTMMTMMTEMEMTMVETCHRWGIYFGGAEYLIVGEEYVDLGSLLFPPPDNRGHTGSTGDYC